MLEEQMYCFGTIVSRKFRHDDGATSVESLPRAGESLSFASFDVQLDQMGQHAFTLDQVVDRLDLDIDESDSS
ncbi:MAG: hypothetical protein NVSMB9_04650 [Isosphaeraceae bacterium]